MREILASKGGHKVPAATLRLLQDAVYCGKILKAYPEIETALIHFMLAIGVTIKDKADRGPAVDAISALLEYFQVFKQQAEHDVKSSAPPTTTTDATSTTTRKAARKSTR